MAKATHGITTETVQKMVFDAGAIYMNYGEQDEKLLWATQGGNSFTVEREVKQIEMDGARGPVKGARRVIEEKAILTTNPLEHSAENWKKFFGGADITDVMDDDGTTVIGNEVRPRQILDGDYIKNLALVATISGSNEPVVVILENALSDDEIEMELEHTEEGVPEIAFAAHWDPADMSRTPYSIRFPTVDSGGQGISAVG